MPIKLDCPRCKQSLAVPKRKAGGYANCPRCKGRFWVPEDAVDDPTLAESQGFSGRAATALAEPAAASSASPPAVGGYGAVSPAAPGPATPQAGAWATPAAPPTFVCPPPPPPPGSPAFSVAGPAPVARPIGAAPPLAPPSMAPPPLPPPMSYGVGMSPAAPPLGASPPPASPGFPVAAPVPFAPQSIPSPMAAPMAPPGPMGPQPLSAAPAWAAPPAATATSPAWAASPGAAAAPASTATFPELPPSTRPPAPPTADRKKVARFITAEVAQSSIKPAADGKLPDLHLHDGSAGDDGKAKSSTMSPLVLVGLLALSVVLSLGIAYLGVPSDDSASSEQKAIARKQIEEEYFSTLDNRKTLLPYQIFLRDAQQAYSRGDYAGERALYRKVLGLLRAEREATVSRGLTGSPGRDKILEDLITVVLSDR